MPNHRHRSGASDASADSAGEGLTRDPLEWPVRAGAVDDVLCAMELRVTARRRRRRRLQLATSAFTVLLVGGALGWNLRSTIPDDAVAGAPPASATISLPDRQVLPDGSIVELRNGARVTVAFSDAFRRVALEAGEAHFQVAHSAERPFLVTAEGVEFRAVGTAFSVQLGADAVELLVTEGQVAVDKSAGSSATKTTAEPVETRSTSRAAGDIPPPLALVGAGNRVVVSTRSETKRIAPAVEIVSEAELGTRLAWRVPRLEFSGTPLADALPLFNRHSKVNVTLGDADLGNVRLSGILRADNVDTLLALLEDSYGIRVQKRSATEIVLHKRH
jgi:transmembrane sensor